MLILSAKCLKNGLDVRQAFGQCLRNRQGQAGAPDHAHLVPGARNAGSSRHSAAPTGGARKRGRGCHLPTHRDTRTVLGALALLVAAASPAAALEDPIALPSGLVAEFQELRIEARDGQGALARFRFVAEDLEQTAPDLEVLTADMSFLCDEVALPAIPVEYPDPGQIVISIGAAATEFGTARPDILQVFEAYRIEDDRCIWEAF